MPNVTQITVSEAGVTIQATGSDLENPEALGQRLLAVCRSISRPGTQDTPPASSNTGRPAAQRGSPPSGRSASPAQRRYIASLCDNDPRRIGQLLSARGLNSLDELPSKDAHQIIDSLKGGGS